MNWDWANVAAQIAPFDPSQLANTMLVAMLLIACLSLFVRQFLQDRRRAREIDELQAALRAYATASMVIGQKLAARDEYPPRRAASVRDSPLAEVISLRKPAPEPFDISLDEAAEVRVAAPQSPERAFVVARSAVGGAPTATFADAGWDSPNVETLILKVNGAASVDEVAAQCEMSRAEAGLVLALKRRKVDAVVGD